MREIQKQVTILKTVYVANDGKEFDDLSECREWDAGCYNRAVARLEEIPHIVTNSSELHMYNGDETEDVWLMIPRTADDIDAIRDVESYYWTSSLTYESIGRPLAIRLGYHYDSCDVYDLSELLRDATTDITRAINSVMQMSTEQRSESNGR